MELSSIYGRKVVCVAAVNNERTSSTHSLKPAERTRSRIASPTPAATSQTGEHPICTICHCWDPVYANSALTSSVGSMFGNSTDASGFIFICDYLTTLPKSHYARCLGIRVCRLHHVIVNLMRLNTV